MSSLLVSLSRRASWCAGGAWHLSVCAAGLSKLVMGWWGPAVRSGAARLTEGGGGESLEHRGEGGGGRGGSGLFVACGCFWRVAVSLELFLAVFC